MFHYKGEAFASGGYRQVYYHATLPGYVVKTCLVDRFGNPRSDSSKHTGVQHNKQEWEIWNKHKGLRKWLVPCIAISPDGWCLLQPLGEIVEKVPEGYPDVLYDGEQCRNWVLIDGSIVCCDYGHRKVMERLSVSKNTYTSA